MNPIFKRVVTALGTAVLAVSLFVWCPLKALTPILMVLSALLQLEFYQMASAYKPAARPGILFGFLWLLLTSAYPGASLFPSSVGYGVLAFGVVLFFFSCFVMLQSRYEHPLGSIAITLLGFFYIPFLLSFFLRVAQLGPVSGGSYVLFAMPSSRVGLYTLLALIAITKLSDMGGFAFGLAFGRHKMCPKISPKKSWEGFLGSLLGSVLMALLFRHIAWKFGWTEVCPVWGMMTVAHAIVMGCMLACIGTLGDLVESRFKRECGVKDSGTFMPAGLGGLLDMFDSILFVPALVYPLFVRFAQ